MAALIHRQLGGSTKLVLDVIRYEPPHIKVSGGMYFYCDRFIDGKENAIHFIYQLFNLFIPYHKSGNFCGTKYSYKIISCKSIYFFSHGYACNFLNKKMLFLIFIAYESHKNVLTMEISQFKFIIFIILLLTFREHCNLLVEMQLFVILWRKQERLLLVAQNGER